MLRQISSFSPPRSPLLKAFRGIRATPSKSLLAVVSAMALATLPVPSRAQQAQQTDMMIVFDASNSMWGQIDGRAKVEIARDALSTVVRDLAPGTRLGMMVYGAERRGDCSDIALRVPVDDATRAAPGITAIAQGLTPRGKTPLTDAVRRAAEALRYTENRATVVLITDGIESCDADPCSLATTLEQAGVDFTAHVVGFGLSPEEGQQVACLATRTGGVYLPASDAGQLSDALGRALTPIAPDAADFTPAETPAVPEANVTLILRDAEGSFVLNARSFSEVVLRGPDGQELRPDLSYDRDFTAQMRLAPGAWSLDARRVAQDGAGEGYVVEGLPLTIASDAAQQTLDLALHARLVVETRLSEDEIVPPRTNLPSLSGDGRADYALFALQDGRMAEKPLARGAMGFDEAVAPGDYILRGTFARMITRDKLVHVGAGQNRLFVFDFGVSRVLPYALTPEGVRVIDAGGKPQTTYAYPDAQADAIRRGGAPRTSKGGPAPLYLTPGQWKLNVGAEGGGKARSEILLTVGAPGETLEFDVPAGQTLSAEDVALLDTPEPGDCLARVGVGHKACLVESPFAWVEGKPGALKAAPPAAAQPIPVPTADPAPVSPASPTGTAPGFSLDGFAAPPASGLFRTFAPGDYGMIADAAMCSARLARLAPEGLSLVYPGKGEMDFACAPAAGGDGIDCTATAARQNGAPVAVPDVKVSVASTAGGPQLCLGSECELLAPCPTGSAGSAPTPAPSLSPAPAPVPAPVPAPQSADSRPEGAWSFVGCTRQAVVLRGDGAGMLRFRPSESAAWTTRETLSCDWQAPAVECTSVGGPVRVDFSQPARPALCLDGECFGLEACPPDAARDAFGAGQ